ncbi:tripartite tricarboxylate transporter substrate binding protein [Xylophilus rhododendri]|uniref:Tripartite tricarboxylate transporter substrate binding protein n=1 Tax=Xylophilus rhododendri TaxID=2697032 RepID=A0A857J6K4_9BURK|nr:tripartite tricarboxylate transporter substrate binding protein [Xylophilus rhododendri]QHI98651.1 tripartite tricarboxylate transporter substrate binding protein [Xylophilus rhododendri]
MTQIVRLLRRRLPPPTLLLLALCSLLPLPGRAAEPAAWPTRAIRIVVPFPAGGYADNLARVIATDMSNTFGQPVLVDNRPGAGGNIGADLVAKSAPDGYTVVMGTIGTHAVNPWIYPRMPFNAATDFAPVAFVADAESVLVVNPAVPARSVQELIALARARPGDLTFASGGPGTTGHLAGELFKAVTHTFITHIPYKGNVPALTDLVAGQVSLSFATLQPALPFITAGKLIPLATLGTSRAAALPAVPTLAEAGLKNFEVRNWTGMLAPAGTPAAITQKLAQEVDKALSAPAVRQTMAAQGLSYTKMGPEAFGQFIQSESAKWAAVVKAANVKAD